MRLLITADLHYRPSQRETYLQFSRWIEAQTPDCLVVAGDVGHPLRLFQRALQLFAELNCPKLVLSGNHDVYKGEQDSRTLWEVNLPQAAREEGFGWLEEETLMLAQAPTAGLAGSWSGPAHGEKAVTSIPPKTIGVVGTMGWYDYSSRAPHMPFDDSDYRVLKHLVNHDADYVDWPWSDRAMARFLGRRFSKRLADLVENPAVDQIVVVTHVPIFPEAVPHYPESEFYNLMRAYLGNFTLGKWVRQQPKVTHVISGHIHHRGHWTIAGAHGPIDFRLVGSRPGAPAGIVLDL